MLWQTLTDNLEVVWGAILAAAIVVLLTPAVGGMARLLGVVDEPGSRRVNPSTGARFVLRACRPGARFPAARARDEGPVAGHGRRDDGRGDRRLPRSRLVGEARRADRGRREPHPLWHLGSPLSGAAAPAS